MNASQIRESFISFFKTKGHVVTPSVSLMPTAPNLLFTNAGMNAFIPYFLGEAKAPYAAAVNTQKCIRAGGKHNDLEDVGFDTYHHTFFEMLGNWSFGGYFKKEAIEWAWELLTQNWKFPKNRLYATVYKPEQGDPADFDQESYDIWLNIFQQEGLDPNIHIRLGGKKDNFWMMGNTGPCGPCTEIHMDLTPHGDTQGKIVNADSPYCIELWNLVFIQFNAEEDGSFRRLRSQYVDTGMGFERIAGILATTQQFTDFSKVASNYNSDLFKELFEKLSDLSGHVYQNTFPQDRNAMSEVEKHDCAFRVIADHIRTLSFAIADGIMPGNEGRNYVLRRMLRRSILFSKKIELKPGFLSHLVPILVRKMGDVFEELKKHENVIQKVLQNEEASFGQTLDRGLVLFEKMIDSKKDSCETESRGLNQAMLSGKDAFLLYDTYGFPLDLTQLIAREHRVSVDVQGFEEEMEKQRERARQARQTKRISVSEGEHALGRTEFVGYDPSILINYQAQLLDVVQYESRVLLIFDQTPFYPEKGGQVGDSGKMVIEGRTIDVVNTFENDGGYILHAIHANHDGDQSDMGSFLKGLCGAKAMLSVDLETRRSIQRNHTATHILHWALRKILGDHVHQAGSLVSRDYLRFDFTHFEAISPEKLKAIEVAVNESILNNKSVITEVVPFEKKPKECLAFFGDKYGSEVRMVKIADYSIELCGGTHVDATGEIGFFQIQSEFAVAAGTRRIEAITGRKAYEVAQSNADERHKLAIQFSCRPDELLARVHGFMQERDTLAKEVRRLQQKQASGQVVGLIESGQEVDGIFCIVGVVSVENPEDMRGIAIQLTQKVNASMVILGSKVNNKANMIALCSPEAIEKGYQAGSMVREICTKLGGKGGGKADFAMGGAPNPEHLNDVLNQFFQNIIRKEHFIS